MTMRVGENSESLRPEDPRQLGGYRLLSRLGRGGMGTVFLGENAAGGRVAVKVINRELASEESFRQRFRSEVTSARQVRRFCTAPVLDAELDHDPLFVVTEYIEGPSLEHAVAERGALSGSDLEGLAVGMATALAAIHGAGIVHRDLKPANVLLSSTGPRVIDFGIARALDATDGPTRTGQFVGTPNYLPPELLRGEPVTSASDVFAWGCVMTYAGTGRAPFAGNTVPEIFYRVAHDPPKLDGLDPALRDVVAAALDKDPGKRPSVQEVLGRLVGHAQPDPARLAETVQAAWHSPTGSPHAGSPAGPSHAGPGSTGPTYPQGGAPQTVMQPPGSLPTRGDAPQPPRRGGGLPKKSLGIGAGAVAALVLGTVALFAVLGGNGPPENLATSFADDFSNNESGWDGSTFTSQYGYKDSRYRMETSTSESLRVQWLPKDSATQIPERMLVSVNVNVVQGTPDSRYGMTCRGNNDGETQYTFLVRKDGKGALLRKVAGAKGTKELANVDSVSSLDDEGVNDLQIACEPDKDGKEVRLRLWVNGDQVLDETDADQPLAHGWAGIAVERGGNAAQQITADFDDFDLSKILD
ncbi:serine/threonine protein kinase [Actinomadura sp. 9N407]|uniref:serine/threonine protein kinase n=1 Tax=Actinomadura sp. 9N407 TaxID=3375154 RepID=UPI0037B5581E